MTNLPIRSVNYEEIYLRDRDNYDRAILLMWVERINSADMRRKIRLPEYVIAREIPRILKERRKVPMW